MASASLSHFFLQPRKRIQGRGDPSKTVAVLVRPGGPFQKCTRRRRCRGQQRTPDPVPVRVKKLAFAEGEKWRMGLKRRGGTKDPRESQENERLDGWLGFAEETTLVAGGRKRHGSTLKAASPNFQSLSPKHPDRQSDTYSLPTTPTAHTLPETGAHHTRLHCSARPSPPLHIHHHPAS